MKKFYLTIGESILRKFNSFGGFSIYLIDVLIRILFILLLSFFGISQFFIITSSVELSRFVFLYVFVIFMWGLLLIKSAIIGFNAFGKSKYDIYFMGLLLLYLVSVLLAENKNTGVFGSYKTWSFSVISLLSISIVYYIGSSFFKYIRGIKWLSLGVLLSTFIPSTYFLLSFVSARKINDPLTMLLYAIFIIPIILALFSMKTKLWIKIFLSVLVIFVVYLSKNFVISEVNVGVEYLTFAVLTIPLSTALVFVFRKNFLKFLTLCGIIINLFFIAFYSSSVPSSLFVLSIGILALFLLFYFVSWVKNSKLILNYISKIFRDLKVGKKVKKVIVADKRIFLLIIYLSVVALWIILFGAFTLGYWHKNISPYIGNLYREDLLRMSNIQMWLIGKNDLSKEFSSFEVLNILGNYGLISVLLFIVFLLVCIYSSAKIVIRFLNSGMFKNLIIGASLFVNFVCIFVMFFLFRFNSMIYVFWVVNCIFLSIVQDIIEGRSLYQLERFESSMSLGGKIFRIASVLVIIVLIFGGAIGLLSGGGNGLFNGR